MSLGARKPNKLNVLGSKKAKVPKQDTNNWSRSPMPEEGEPIICIWTSLAMVTQGLGL